MVSLAHFLEEIKIADALVGKDAYKMDRKGSDGMRHHAGLGECRCCDYFIENGKSVVLIEDTRLLETIKNYKKKYGDLSKSVRKNLTSELIRDENVLKVYGALLVLCRLAAKHHAFQKIAQAKKYHFWLVVSDAQSPSMMIPLGNLEARLSGALGGGIGKWIDEIKIVPIGELKTKISNYLAAP